jgi:hypothetical protein
MAVELYDEHEQSERVRRWIKEYGFSIVLGLVLAFGGIFGLSHLAGSPGDPTLPGRRIFRASSSANWKLTIWTSPKNSSGHARLGFGQRLCGIGLAALMAGALYRRWPSASRPLRSIGRFWRIGALESVRAVATVRLARVLEAQGDVQAGTGLVEGEAPTGFQGAWAEVRGDLLMARGQPEQARWLIRKRSTT